MADIKDIYGNGKSLESLNKDKKEHDDKKYRNEKIDLTTAKSDLAKQLGYGVFVPKENEQKIPYRLPIQEKQKKVDGKKIEKKEVDLKNLSEKVKENKYFPVLERLFNSKQINEKSFKEVLTYIQGNNNFELDKIKIDEKDKKIIELNIKKIPGELIKNKEKSKGNEQKLTESQQEKNKKEFFEDFPEKEKQMKSGRTQGFQKEVLEIIGKNYVKIDTGNKEQDKKENFSTAIKTSSNNILNKSKNLNRDTETFKKAIKDIRGEDPEKQLKGLETLYIISGQAEGKLGKTKTDKDLLENKKNQYLYKRKFDLHEDYIKIIEELNTKVINEKQRQKLIQEKKSIEKQAQEIQKGEVFGGNKKIETNDKQKSNETPNA